MKVCEEQAASDEFIEQLFVLVKPNMVLPAAVNVTVYVTAQMTDNILRPELDSFFKT